MAPLFQRADGFPMQFYLTNLTKELLENLTGVIESNGGKVENTMNEDEYPTFTVPWECYTYRFVFDVLFIQNCVKYNTILSIDQYYIGDSRLKTQKDKMFRLIMGNSTVAKMENLSLNETLDDLKNLSTISSTSICPKEVRIVLDRLKPSEVINPLSSVKRIEADCIKTEATKSEIEFEDTIYEAANSPRTLQPRIKDEEYFSNDNGSSDTEYQASDEDIKEEYLDSEPSTSTATKRLKQTTCRISKRRSNIIEPSDSELETSDIDNIEGCERNEIWISTKKPKLENSSSSNEDLEDQPRNSNLNKRINKIAISTVPTQEMIEWAEEVTKDMEKDEFGYPEGNEKEYAKWEKDIMIAFIIRMGKYDACKGSKLWQLAYNLKILPRRRTYASLVYECRTHILTHIEDFNLPPEIEAKFKNIRMINSKVYKPSKQLQAWAKEVTANMEKDELGYPTSHYQYTWEYETMIEFLINSGLMKEACSLTTWEFAYNLKIFPRLREPRNLHKVFRSKVLAEIEKFNLPKDIEEQFLKVQRASFRKTVKLSEDLKAWADKMRKPATNKKTGKNYINWKNRLMLEFLIKADQIENYKSIETWKAFKQLKLFSDKTSCHQLYIRFRDRILPMIEHFDLPEDIVQRFTKAMIPKSSKDVEVTEEVQMWAAEVLKRRRKDKFGYPIELESNFQPWERELMLEFVRKVGRIDLAKAPNFWKHAVDLKLLPKKRTIFSLAGQYRYSILPYIEDYSLPPEEEAKFIKTRTDADVKICKMGKNGKEFSANQLDISIS